MEPSNAEGVRNKRFGAYALGRTFELPQPAYRNYQLHYLGLGLLESAARTLIGQLMVLNPEAV